MAGRLTQAGVPCAPVLTRTAMLSDPQVVANAIVVEAKHPQAGLITAGATRRPVLRNARLDPRRRSGTGRAYRCGAGRTGLRRVRDRGTHLQGAGCVIDLYYWPTPNGWKVSIMLEETGLPYRLNPVNIGVGDQFKPEFLTISPNARMPAIVDYDTPDGQLSIFESGAILQHLAEKRPVHAHSAAWAEILEWLFWQVGNLGPMAGQPNHFVTYAPTVEGPLMATPQSLRRRGQPLPRACSTGASRTGISFWATIRSPT